MLMMFCYKNDIGGIEKTKEYLRHQFVNKDMRKHRYFLGIEFVHDRHGAILSQGKYSLNLLEKTGLLGCKSISTPMDSDLDFFR